MTKAVFMDYTGTTIQESGVEMREVVARICKNSTLHEPKEVMAAWWERLTRCEAESFGASYLTEDEIVDKALEEFVECYGLNEDLEELHRLIRRFWVHAPLFPDVKDFYAACPLPIYVLSNNGVRYVEEAMALHALAPAGMICADMVRAYKPRRELFEKALEVSACRGDEAVHIGDSYRSDVLGALGAGIRPILLQREGGARCEDVTTVRSLGEVLPLLR